MERLPNGLDSYPECQMKASFLHEKFAQSPVPLDRSQLPDRLVHYLDNPPPSSIFVPSVDMFALNYVLLDAFGRDVDRFRKYTVEINRQKLTSNLYRALFLFVTPAGLVAKAGERWKKVHQGVTMEAKMTGERTFEGVIRFPPHIACEMMVNIWADILALAVGLAGAKNVRTKVVEQSPTLGRYTGGWD